MDLYLDIETIPTQRDDIRADIAAGVSAPATYKKPESIAQWEAEQKPAAVDEAIRKTALDGSFGEIVVIGYALGRGEPESIVGTEKELLQAFNAVLPDKKCKVIGHNVMFDIRFLWQRAKINGVFLPAWWPVNAKPWDQDAIFDTMTAWAGTGNRISLDRLCKAFSLAGKGDIDGSKVWDYWKAGKHTEIAEYCKSDVRLVREIYSRIH